MLITNFNRAQLLTVLPKGGTAIEIGTYRGNFAESILTTLQPDELHLVDPWAMDEHDEYISSYGAKREAMYSAYDQVQSRFRAQIEARQVTLHREYSRAVATAFPDRSFDFIYVDAMHDYANVRADLLAYKDKIKPDGFILGHDFSNTRMGRRMNFGVVQAVREFVNTEDFDLVLITNEAAPTYLLAQTGNTTTLPALRGALLDHRDCALIEIDQSLLDRYSQQQVLHGDGRKGQLMRFG